MKRKMMCVTGVMLILLMIAVTGCGKTNATSSGSPTGSGTGGSSAAGSETTADTENTTESAAGTETTVSGNNRHTETSAADSEMSYTMISEEEAKVIALKDADVSENDVSGIRIKREKDDGIWQYEVDFYVGDTEYDYDIDASTGQILSKDMEINDDFRSTGESR